MKILFRLLIPTLLLMAFCLPLEAQSSGKYPNFELLTEAEQAMYDKTPTKILPDAVAAFNAAKYGHAIALCNYHYIYYGDEIGSIPGGVNELKEKNGLDTKAKRCYDLTIEMNTLVKSGSISSAKDKARSLLQLNPDDENARKVLYTSAPSVSPGVIRVISTPVGATIYLDGKNTGLSTPDLLDEVSPGKHEVSLVLNGYNEYNETVIVSSGGKTTVDRTLSRVSVSQPETAVGSQDNLINGHEYVDLGLSVKWATCNVGASKPEDYGDYFAWGETSPKLSYHWEEYKFWISGDDITNIKFWKYNTNMKRGTVDNKTTLDFSDDAARANWGGSWRMPTIEELEELCDYCTWRWTSMGGHNGYEVTSKKNGNSIFLPAAGDRGGTSLWSAESHSIYWSSSLRTDDDSHCAWYLYFYSDKVGQSNSSRYRGCTVRPVTE